MSIIGRLKDLRKQAITERSHYYTAAVLEQAIEEIERLQKLEAMIKEVEKFFTRVITK